MKILLVSANTYSVPYKVYPLGVSYLKTYMNDHYPDWEVSIYDFNFGSYSHFEHYLDTNKFDLIGLSLRNSDDVNFYAKESFIQHYKNICSIIRNNSETPIVAGGPCISIFPELLLDELLVDFVIPGEGEQSLCQLINSIKSGNSIEDIDGVMFRKKNGDLYFNEKKSFASHLNVRFDPELAKFYLNEGGMLNIQTKRGCPYHCIYCTYPIVDGSEVRKLDARLIVENIKELIQIEKNNYLFFTDSVFNICEDYNEELAHRIIESGVKMKWGAYFAPRNFNKQRIELYKKSGLTHIEFGTDSFSNTQLKNYQKSFTFEDVRQATQICNETGVYHSHFLILGGIGETEETLSETIKNSDLLENTIIFPFVGMRIYPQTKLYDIAVRENKITTSSILEPTYYISDHFDVSTLQEKTRHCKNIWVYPDAEKNPIVDQLRLKHRRGPLWEYLKYKPNTGIL